MARQGELTRQLAESLQEEERTFLIGQYAALLLDDLERDTATEALPADAAMALRIARRYADADLEARIDLFLTQHRLAGPGPAATRTGEGLFDDQDAVPDAAGTGLFDAPAAEGTLRATSQAAAADTPDAAEAGNGRTGPARRAGRRTAEALDADLDLTALGAAADGSGPAPGTARAEARGRQRRDRGQADLPRRQARQDRAGFDARKGHGPAAAGGFEPGPERAERETPGFGARKGHESTAAGGFEPGPERAERETPGFGARKGHESTAAGGFEPGPERAERETPGFDARKGHESTAAGGFEPGPERAERETPGFDARKGHGSTAAGGFEPGPERAERETPGFDARKGHESTAAGGFEPPAAGRGAAKRGFTPSKGHENEATPGFAVQGNGSQRQRRGSVRTQGHEAHETPGSPPSTPPGEERDATGASRDRRAGNRPAAAAVPGETDANAAAAVADDVAADRATGKRPGPTADGGVPDGDSVTGRAPTAIGDDTVDDALFRQDGAEGAAPDGDTPADRGRSGAAVADEQRRPTLGLTDAIQAQREAEAAARAEALARAAKARDELQRRRHEREAKQQAEREARSRRLAETKPVAPRRGEASADAGLKATDSVDDEEAADDDEDDERVADDDLLAGLTCAVSLDDLERYLGVKVVREDRALLERRLQQKLREAPVRALLRSLPEAPVGYALLPRLARVAQAGQDVRLNTAQLIRRHLDLLDDAGQIVRRYKEAPFFLRETPATDWVIVSCDALPSTLGKSYAQQRQAIKQYAAGFQTSERRIGRRTVVEALFDMIVVQVVAKEPMLRRTVDMTDTKVGLNNLVFVNHGANGIRVSDIGRLDSHPQLGTCPVW
jgi:hypothetical protein